MIDFSILIMSVKHAITALPLAVTSTQHHRSFARKLESQYNKRSQIKIVLKFMARGTDEGLASHIKENLSTI